MPARAIRPTTMELAVRVLRAAIQRARGGRIDTHDVQLALRCLLPLISDRRLLVEFWYYAGQLPNANRADSCDAVLASILSDLREGAGYPDADAEARRFIVEALRQVKDDRDAEASVKRRHYWAPPPRRRP